jgi:hypothetical protein
MRGSLKSWITTPPQPIMDARPQVNMLPIEIDPR